MPGIDSHPIHGKPVAWTLEALAEVSRLPSAPLDQRHHEETEGDGILPEVVVEVHRQYRDHSTLKVKTSDSRVPIFSKRQSTRSSFLALGENSLPFSAKVFLASEPLIKTSLSPLILIL